ncbi:MAG: 50S ribosomal protein L9 [Gammaproteobacteria bacterium]|nr:50S ribosomal protein L9 [Gammaproteobacteria bacterium]
MQIILLEKVQNLGGLGDAVNVRAGYGRNFLIPKGMAVPATKDNLSKFEAKRAEFEKAADDVIAVAKARADTLVDKKITLAQKAGEEGKLFGSVGTIDIARALSDSGTPVEKQEIRLPEGAIREVGDFDITVHLHTDINVTVKVSVVAE